MTKEITNQDIKSITFSSLYGSYRRFTFLLFELQSLYKKHSIRGNAFLSSQLHSICIYLNKVQELSLETDTIIKGFYSLYMIVDPTHACKDLLQQVQPSDDRALVVVNMKEELIANGIVNEGNTQLFQAINVVANFFVKQNQVIEYRMERNHNETMMMGMSIKEDVRSVKDRLYYLVDYFHSQKYRRFILAYGQYLNLAFLPLIVHQFLYFQNWKMIVQGIISSCKHLLSCSFIH